MPLSARVLHTMRLRRPTAAVFACALALGAPARAEDEKNACASASEEAQRLRGEGKLLDARQKLLLCSRTSCPSVVKQDCDGMLTTIQMQIPSLVVLVHDEDGRDAVGARVLLDGAPVDTTSGRALPLDPGLHKLHVEAKGKVTVDQSVVVHEGERARPVTVTLAATPSPKAPASATRAAPPPAQLAASVPPIVYVLGTLAGVAAVSFAALEIKAVSDATHLRNTCAPRCPQGDVDAVSTETVGANVSIGLGLAFTGAALAAWLLGRGGPPPTTAVAPSGLAVRF